MGLRTVAGRVGRRELGHGRSRSYLPSARSQKLGCCRHCNTRSNMTFPSTKWENMNSVCLSVSHHLIDKPNKLLETNLCLFLNPDTQTHLWCSWAGGIADIQKENGSALESYQTYMSWCPLEFVCRSMSTVVLKECFVCMSVTWWLIFTCSSVIPVAFWRCRIDAFVNYVAMKNWRMMRYRSVDNRCCFYVSDVMKTNKPKGDKWLCSGIKHCCFLFLLDVSCAVCHCSGTWQCVGSSRTIGWSSSSHGQRGASCQLFAEPTDSQAGGGHVMESSLETGWKHWLLTRFQHFLCL